MLRLALPGWLLAMPFKPLVHDPGLWDESQSAVLSLNILL
jgi:hypothetical protein